VNTRLIDPFLRYALVGFGLVLVAVGVMFFFSPFPIGVPFAGFGLFLLLTSSKRAQRIIRRLRARHDWLDRRMQGIEDKSSGKLRAALETSKPGTATGSDG